MQVNHFDIVRRLSDEQPAEKTVPGALAFCLRVLAALPPHEAAGLLLKPAGENITDFRGQMVSAGRICYPDGQLYKVLIDIPTTNAPQWADDGTVDPARYVRVTEPVPPGPGPGPVPGPVPGPIDLTPITQQLGRLELLIKDAENQNRLRYNDVIAHFDELKRIIDAK